jgi:hypothetical protein
MMYVSLHQERHQAWLASSTCTQCAVGAVMRGALLLRQTLSRPLLLRLRYVTLIAAIANYVQ